MPQARYFVVRNPDDTWTIQFQGETFGPYKSQSEAMLFAVDAARKLGQRGDAAEVCLMGVDGHFRSEWATGREEARS
jgi:hypothetical protein